MTRRLIQLQLGLALYGFALALVVRAGLGLAPWDAFHQGLSRHTGLSIGTVLIIVGCVVLLLWIPLRQRPGVGTISNIFVIGVVLDVGLAVVPEVDGLPSRLSLLAVGMVLNGLGGGAYIGARLGPGPRDGLMTGFSARSGRSLRSVRTVIELTVLGCGVALGGTVGLGTVVYAVTIGPLVQLFLPALTVPERPARAAVPAVGTAEACPAEAGVGT